MRQFFTGLLCLSVWVTPLACLAQQAPTLKAGTLSIQFQQVDFSDFNRQGLELDYSPLPDGVGEVGGGVIYMTKRWKTTVLLVLGQGNTGGQGNQQESRYEYIGGSTGTAFNLLDPESRWFLGPEITALLRAEQVTLTNSPPVNGLSGAIGADFVKLTRFGGVADVGLNVHRHLKYRSENDKGALLTLRGGFRLDPGDQWRVDQALPVNNTGINAGGWYGSISYSFVW
ncbi:MAG: hypothetical protein AAFV07_02480 [Bacteroidota bacterium]